MEKWIKGSIAPTFVVSEFDFLHDIKSERYFITCVIDIARDAILLKK